MYDPLTKTYPKPWQGYPNSYWFSGLDTPIENPISRDLEVDIAIIGGGYTGLSAAYHLAKHYSAKVIVLEANSVGWGCSGRNGGFVLPGTGRLSLSDMEKKWGESTTREIYKEFFESIQTVNRMILSGKIDCDQTPGGYLKLAHDAASAQVMQQQFEKLQAYYPDKIELLTPEQVDQSLMHTQNMHGGLYYPNCYSVNPLKLVQGYHRLATEAGADVFTQSPVLKWRSQHDQHTLYTSNGKVKANKVIIATNGYTGKGLHQIVEKRHFPVISSIIVTRPLSQDELQQSGIAAGLMAMDTRSLKYYYRLLPDNRLLFGGRGAIVGKEAELPVHKDRLLDGLYHTFPMLSDIQSDYFWSGWISASYDNYPRLWHSDDKSIHYSMGYCGSGIAFSTQMGKRLAQSVMEPDALPDLPYWQSPLRKFPFARFRRLGLQLFYLFARNR